MDIITEVLERQSTSSKPARWQKLLGHVSAVSLSAVFLVSGLWKISDLPAAAERMVQSLVPVALSLPAAMLVAASETFAGVLLLVPRLRRWGALFSGLILIVFMTYIGLFYNRLLGDDCNCFPWIRRIVGPGFFIGDAAMLALAVLAGWWSAKPRGLRAAACILGGVVALIGVSYGVSAVQQSHIVAPATIEVGGQPVSLRQGRVLLYFFYPECSHCYMVAREMSRWDWTATRVIVVPTDQPQFARDFLNDSGLKAEISTDAALLRSAFPFAGTPYAVALLDGRQVAAFNSGQLEQESFYESMNELGFVQ